MGRPVSWLARATLNCVNSAWNALLKCAECVCPVGSRASLSTTRPVGPYRVGMRKASLSSARADAAKATSAHASVTRILRIMMLSLLLEGTSQTGRRVRIAHAAAARPSRPRGGAARSQARVLA